MRLHLVRFLSLLAVALTLGLAFAHVLEIPGKLRLGGTDWLTVQHNLYVGFGTIGAAVEVTAVALTWLTVILVRERRLAFAWTVAAALLVTAGLIEWGLVVAPVNTALSVWTPSTLPVDWTAWRNRWELGHALHATLFALGFGCLAAALLVETRP
ncbi:hypothetical protein [Benzoatithermus flavus]|uniref:DUF1772 domain-containing protein n=1 Tax=Benzoatithermus flavus TaxID=3108223 RepID=A0ABU8XMD5_9PROT